MKNGFSNLDYIVFIAYCLLIIFIGLYVSRNKKGEKKTAKDYFLASKSLPWWAVGASLIAANISAEQAIGMSGSGFAIGLAIASYEWMAAIALILVGIFFLPVFLKKGIYTMPQFLQERFDNRVRTAMATFWLLVYVFINLTSVLWLGALALETIMGIPVFWGIVGLAVFAAVYSIYGGLKAVAWTDVIQVIFLIAGGLITTILALKAIGGGDGVFAGFTELLDKVPEKFNMIIKKGEMMIPDGSGGTKDAWFDLPGLSVVIGGLWIANISYWGFNQYIIQRGLAAKSIAEAQKGVLFAGFLKLLIPLIVVIPGIAAYLISQSPDAYGLENADVISRSDQAYPWLLHNFVPAGIKGVAFAALVAAIVSSLASMLNSTSTIFTMDIYKNLIDKNVSDTKMVSIGRLASLSALIIAVVMARPLLGGLDQAFQYIQEFTGFITPGVCAIFLAGVFWKRATSNAALWGAGLSIPLSFAFMILLPEVPFMNRWGYVFLILAVLMIVISLIESKEDHPKAVRFEKGLFHTETGFKVGAFILLAIVAALYIAFW
ncbi:MAG: sodium/solute symporter [Bacteroidetes bacterium]|jgi:solute:Na+ symporter, SSS family|nr:sodium/solute symporter [Bacteroidota bacterium]MBT3750505.1 sodium/solute symporter [Bacteroidota bacterium]MBT4398906.1 sodium/solute symporter [Bacteroidota bacterium]MBT4408862.1 sodium/solute symporter [Bacteroidota bacterium]MBT7092687.1 sodium/solute symporter [Bacteroidota bacterium]